MNIRRSACVALALALGMLAGAISSASADIYSTALGNTLSNVPGMTNVTVTAYTQFIASCPTVGGACSGTTATGPSNMNTSTQATWLTNNANWGTITTGTLLVGNQNTTSYTYTGSTAYDVYTVHGDSWYLAFLFSSPITSFSISGLPNNISGIYGFNAPIPPAALLFGTALVGMAMLGRRRRKNGQAVAA